MIAAVIVMIAGRTDANAADRCVNCEALCVRERRGERNDCDSGSCGDQKFFHLFLSGRSTYRNNEELAVLFRSSPPTRHKALTHSHF